MPWLRLALRLTARSIRHPRLARDLIRIAWRFRSRSWYRHFPFLPRSEEHTSELQSQFHLVCRLLLEKKKKKKFTPLNSHQFILTAPSNALSFLAHLAHTRSYLYTYYPPSTLFVSPPSDYSTHLPNAP